MNGKIFAGGALVLGIAIFAGLALLFSPHESERIEPGSAAAAPLIRPHSPVKGSEDVPVTIVEFLDPECESCRAMHPIVQELLREYDGRARLVIRYMPLHGSSMYAASVLEEARELGKYEEALDALFESQPVWGSHQNPRPELIPQVLSAIGIDAGRLAPTAVIEKHGWKIERDQADGIALGVRGTPTFFVNGTRLAQLGYGPLKQAIENALGAANPS